jgi:hypothetical protein
MHLFFRLKIHAIEKTEHRLVLGQQGGRGDSGNFASSKRSATRNAA